MTTIYTQRAAIYSVTVDGDGWINLNHYGHHGERRLTQDEAAKLAGALLDGIRRSRDRNQMARPSYYDSTEILRRQESPLGKAQAAVRRIF